MLTISASDIARLSWIARLHNRQIAVWIVAGILSLAVAGWAIYSYSGGKNCALAATATVPMPKEWQDDVNVMLYSRITEKPQNQLTDAEKQFTAKMEAASRDWRNRTAAPRQDCQKHWSVWRWFSMINPIQPAFADAKIGGYNADDVRLMVVVTIFSTLSLFFFICVGALLFSKNAAVISFAADSVKSLLGFFIGVGMSFMGLAGSVHPN